MKKTICFLLAAALIAFTGCAATNPTEATVQTVPETVRTETASETPIETTVETTAVPETEEVSPAASSEYVPYQAISTPVITGSQTTVHVSTADEFLAALDNNVELVVDSALIDFSTATGYGTDKGEHYYWNEEFDGPSLYLTDLENFTLRGNSDDRTAATLSCVPRYAYVLTFQNCANILVTGLTLGHTKEPGYCAGGVVAFRNCQDALIENCGLYGCGTWGVLGDCSLRLQIINNEIYECSIGGIQLLECDGVTIDGNLIRDLGSEESPGAEYRGFGSVNVTMNGKEIVPLN